MYKVINGKRYDTRTASFLVDDDNGLLPNDFSFLRERLYRKKTGEYFLAAEGGPLTKYGVHVGNNSGFGERIIPYSEDQARKWVEDHCSGDEYDRIFGAASDEDNARITISLPDSLAKKLGIIAQNEVMSVSRLCRIAIERCIKQYEDDIEKYCADVFEPVEEVSNHD